MSETSIKTAAEPLTGVTTSPPAASVPAGTGPGTAPPTPRRRKTPASRVLAFLASLRLTVVLFLLALFLVFVGTLGQMELSTYAAVGKYFRCVLAWIPFQLFVRLGGVFFGVDKKLVIPGSFPFPGGYLIGGALLFNLLAAHLVRFKLSWKRSGILLIHAGLILMLLGELYTGLFAVEGNMVIVKDSSSNYLEHRDRCELAVTVALDKDKDSQLVIPGSKLREGATVSDDKLPFDIEVNRFMPNSLLGVVRGSDCVPELGRRRLLGHVQLHDEVPEDLKDLAKSGAAGAFFAISRAQGIGVDSESRHDVPSAYLTFKDKKDGRPLGSFLVSVWFAAEVDLLPQQFKLDGKSYEVALRFQRTEKPYQITLHKVTAEFYPGTDIPKDYSSEITFQDDSHNDKFNYKIYMNQPLRYRGEAFYQSGVSGTNGQVNVTILQVVRNEGWLVPYISCVLVSLGMLIHFGLSLSTFLSRRAIA